ncbi:MAG: NPXTG-anchored protein [Clostridiales bacterium]|nr:NPXTG-anchored protein [Clostridiales bacterium]
MAFAEDGTTTATVTTTAAPTTAAPTTAAPKLTLIEELNQVRTTFVGSDEDLAWAYAEVISRYAEDVDAIAARQELVQNSSLYPDNWNEFVKIFTDYIPTAVNQQLDIAARLGWDASDQDFVQDVIDLVKGAAESDKAADKAADTATDANPKTGSASAIAVFAVLSVAAAAVVCTKKKED